MLNRSTSLTMSTSVLKSLPGKLDSKRHSPSILYISLPDATSCDTLLHMGGGEGGEGGSKVKSLDPYRIKDQLDPCKIKDRLEFNVFSLDY